MTKANSTKKALLSSTFALLICVAMLIGTTFAWFTDTASTGVNTIQAGTLKVDIVDMHYNSLKNQQLKWESKDGREQADILWEPGCTYYLEPFMIQNKGNLALKYKVIVNGVTGDNKLLEALDFGFYYLRPGFGSARSLDELIEGGKLDNVSEHPGITTLPIYIYAHMKETAGNEYQGLSIEGVGVTVYATQDTYESDINGNQYDKNAQYDDVNYSHASNQAALEAALGNTEDLDKPSFIGLQSGNFELGSANTVNKNTTLAGNGIEETVLTASKLSISKDNITLKDMTVKGNAPAGNEGAIKIGGTNNVIDKIKFIGQGFNGDTKGISVTGSNVSIKNTEISNVFRGIIFWDNIGGDNLIENCKIDNVIYTFNINAGTVKPGTTLTVKNSTLNGWTSYSGCMTKVTFDTCNLGKSNGYAYCVAYADSEFKNCVFNDGYLVAAGSTGKTLKFTDCKLGDGTEITADNFAEKLGDVDADLMACTVIVNGKAVKWN